MAVMDDPGTEELSRYRVVPLSVSALNRKNKIPQFPVPKKISSALYVLQRNRGLVHEINPDLLPGLIAGVKDF